MTRTGAFFAALFMTGIAAAQTAPRSAAEQATVINAIQEYALSYTKSLPNYTCTQTTKQITARLDPLTGKPSSGTSVIEEQLSPANNKEIRKVSRIDGRAAAPDGPDQLMGTYSRGEFGNLLDNIFEPATGASLRWDRLATLNRRRVYVFAFRVPQSRGYTLTESKHRRIQVPFEGLVYADYETKAVVRIDMKCVDIPASSEYIGAGPTLDYRPARVACQEFILPAHYLLHFQMRRGFVTNDAEYTAYRRFSAPKGDVRVAVQ